MRSLCDVSKGWGGMSYSGIVLNGRLRDRPYDGVYEDLVNSSNDSEVQVSRDARCVSTTSSSMWSNVWRVTDQPFEC
jgi:hypothetical protein